MDRWMDRWRDQWTDRDIRFFGGSLAETEREIEKTRAAAAQEQIGATNTLHPHQQQDVPRKKKQYRREERRDAQGYPHPLCLGSISLISLLLVLPLSSRYLGARGGRGCAPCCRRAPAPAAFALLLLLPLFGFFLGLFRLLLLLGFLLFVLLLLFLPMAAAPASLLLLRTWGTSAASHFLLLLLLAHWRRRPLFTDSSYWRSIATTSWTLFVAWRTRTQGLATDPLPLCPCSSSSSPTWRASTWR